MRKHHFCTSLVLMILVLPTLMYCQQLNERRTSELIEKLNKFSLGGYGAMNYYNFNWQTDSVKRNAIDNERFILALGYKWNDKIKLNTEIEFEHGGTGVEVEFDRFEEFGEFEFDVSKGGEVLIEQMNLQFSINKYMDFKVGRLKVPFSLMFNRDEPTDYLTAINSEMETQILPENWTENGLALFGVFGSKDQFHYNISFVNGLDGSAFNSANWVKRGNQRRFEMVNAENFALCMRLDYQTTPSLMVGFSGYGSNTTDNRPKPDLRVSTPIGLAEVHFVYHKKAVQLQGVGLYGALSNSEALTNQNRNLSNNLNVKRTPVGAACLGAFIEAGLEIYGGQGIMKSSNDSKAVFYGRFDYYDTMFKTQGVVFNNPRWARHSFTFGTVYSIIKEVQFKLQYTLREVGAPAPTSVQGGTSEKSFIAGFAFEF